MRRGAWFVLLLACHPATKDAPDAGSTVEPAVTASTEPKTSSSKKSRRDRVREGDQGYEEEVAVAAPDAAVESDTADAGDEPSFATGDPNYTEPDCALSDLSATAKAYQPGQSRAALEAIAKARYPTALAFVRAQEDKALAVWLAKAPDTFDGVMSRFETVAHEGSHIWRAKKLDMKREVYPIRQDLTLETKRIPTFLRSEILSVHVDADSDPYANVYLAGQTGAQMFPTLLDEYQAYAHGLVARYCTRDFVPEAKRVSARDGILAMMYYVETYLAIGREKHKAQYDAIVGDAGHRRVILTVWDRAELWLRRSKNEKNLGINDARMARWVYEPSRIAEITRLRATAP